MTNPQRKRLSASIRLNPLWKCISFTFHWPQSLWGDLLAAHLKAPLNPHSARIGYRHQTKRSLSHPYKFLLNPAPVLNHGTLSGRSQSRHGCSFSDFHPFFFLFFLIWCEVLCGLWGQTWLLLVTILVLCWLYLQISHTYILLVIFEPKIFQIQFCPQ